MEGVSVLFQRASDVVSKVDSGLADLGVTGLNLVQEYRAEEDSLLVLLPDLGFSRCRLVLAVPEAWVDVVTIADLADLAADFRARGRTLRVITGSPNLVRDFLYGCGIMYFTIVEGEGALEAAPAIDTADIVADITETGTTLRDNRLKILEGGTIIESQACLIGNRHALRAAGWKREQTRQLLELIEANQRSRRFRIVTANMRGESSIRGSRPCDPADRNSRAAWPDRCACLSQIWRIRERPGGYGARHGLVCRHGGGGGRVCCFPPWITSAC